MPLWYAALRGDAVAASASLAEGADPDRWKEAGISPREIAAAIAHGLEVSSARRASDTRRGPLALSSWRQPLRSSRYHPVSGPNSH